MRKFLGGFMRKNGFKKIIILVIFVLLLGLIGCEKFNKSEDKVKTSNVNLGTLLEYKGTYVGDNSAISNIISNIPANIYSAGLELQTNSEPYEITIKYKEFEDIIIRSENDLSLSSFLENVVKSNAMIIFSLVKNVEIINFNIDDVRAITYKRNELIEDYKEDFGNNFEKITMDKAALESFVKNSLYSRRI